MVMDFRSPASAARSHGNLTCGALLFSLDSLLGHPTSCSTEQWWSPSTSRCFWALRDRGE